MRGLRDGELFLRSWRSFEEEKDSSVPMPEPSMLIDVLTSMRPQQIVSSTAVPRSVGVVGASRCTSQKVLCPSLKI